MYKRKRIGDMVMAITSSGTEQDEDPSSSRRFPVSESGHRDRDGMGPEATSTGAGSGDTTEDEL